METLKNTTCFVLAGLTLLSVVVLAQEPKAQRFEAGWNVVQAESQARDRMTRAAFALTINQYAFHCLADGDLRKETMDWTHKDYMQYAEPERLEAANIVLPLLDRGLGWFCPAFEQAAVLQMQKRQQPVR